MDTNIRDGLKKLAWLELAVPLNGPTRRLAEKLIRRTAKHSVSDHVGIDPYGEHNDQGTPVVTPADMPVVTPEVTPVVAATEVKPPASPEELKQKVASLKARYERR